MLAHEELRPLDVLLVEDNRGDALLVERALWEVAPRAQLRIVPDGMVALHLLRERRDNHEREVLPDIVLLDLDLPQLSGLDVLAQIRAEPAFRSMPVVVLSSSFAPRDIARAEALRATAYLNKPPTDYRDVMRTIVGFVQPASRRREKTLTPSPDHPIVMPATLAADHFKLAFQLAASPILIADAQARVVDLNAAAEHVFERERRALIGHSIDRVFVSGSRGPLRDSMSTGSCAALRLPVTHGRSSA